MSRLTKSMDKDKRSLGAVTETEPVQVANNGAFLFIPVPKVTKSGLCKRGKLKILLNEEDILLVCVKGQIYAFQAACPHQGGPLEDGEIEELPDKSKCIKCPWHSWKFNITSGECVFPGQGSNRKLTIYPVQINVEEIRIGFRTLSLNSSF